MYMYNRVIPLLIQILLEMHSYNTGDANISWSMTVNPARAYFEIDIVTLNDYSGDPLTLEYQTNLMV